MAANAPVERITQLRAQGYTNSQVIDILQREGVDSATVFDALNQLQTPNAGITPPPPPSPNGGSTPSLPDMPSMQPQMNEPTQSTPPPMPSYTSPSMPSPQPMQQMPSMQPSHHMQGPDPLTDSSTGMPKQTPSKDVSTEEYVEAIIEEKWNELESDIQKIVQWKTRSEQQIQTLGQQVEDLKDRFDKLHAALIGKIESYDKNILEVGAEIKAMEKVFSKVLPIFTDNVKQLNDVTDKLTRQAR